MLKVVGSLLIFAGSLGIAFCLKLEVAAHVKLLYDLRNMWILLSQNMKYRMLPMELILQENSGVDDARLKIICQEIGERLQARKDEYAPAVWREVFFKYKKELGLSKMELELAGEVGKAFFGKKIEENEKYIRLYLERLDFMIEEARGKQKEKEKVLQTVTVMSGFVVILLLI